MTKIIVITPGYISHYKPIAMFLNECSIEKDEILIATNNELKEIVEQDGFEHIEFQAWKNSNPGMINMEKQLEEERRILEASYEATKQGMTSALHFQAEHRIHDLFNNLSEIEKRLDELEKHYHPQVYIVVQLCYNVTAILEKKGARYITFVTGNPDQLPRQDQIYGYPHFLASDIYYEKEKLDELLEYCSSVQEEATRQYIALTGKEEKNVFSVASKEMVIYNYPAMLIKHRDILPHEYYLGSSCREAEKDDDLEEELKGLKSLGKKIVYISFGTVFSVRGDVLSKIFQALNEIDCAVVVATGVMDSKYLRYLKNDWLCREFIPQVLVLKYADLLIGHGGNNSITEALTYGVPIMVFPFASDQFFSAKSIEENELGAVCDPQKAKISYISEMIKYSLSCRDRATLVKKYIQERKEKQKALKKINEMVRGY